MAASGVAVRIESSPMSAECNTLDPASLRRLLHDCLASEAAQQAACLRLAARTLGLPSERHERLEAMLCCEAYESAALLVLGAHHRFLLSRGGMGGALASVALSAAEEDVTVEADTPALAILAALAAALLAEERSTSIPPRAEPAEASALLH